MGKDFSLYMSKVGSDPNYKKPAVDAVLQSIDWVGEDMYPTGLFLVLF